MTNPASGSAAGTAIGPMLAVAVEQYTPQAQRLVLDELAYQFLPSGMKALVSLARWPAVRKFLSNIAEKCISRSSSPFVFFKWGGGRGWGNFSHPFAYFSVYLSKVNQMIINPEEVYQASNTAFDQGNFPKARLLASQCLVAAPRDSYWHFGALGLKCWAANYLGDNATVEREAAKLLSSDAGADKSWFDGLALFNLGLVSQRTRRTIEAKTYFTQASQCYAASDVNSGQHPIGPWNHKLFAAIAHWASSGAPEHLQRLAQELACHPASAEELEYLTRAVDLYLRRARGESVTADAETAARQGVSRAVLAYLLLEKKLPTLH
jgi:hypothetical protein